MKVELTELRWLSDYDDCSLAELAVQSGLSADELQQLIESGALTPTGQRSSQPSFRAEYVVIAVSARRLRDDFELDAQGLAVATSLLRRIQELEAQLDRFRALLPRAPR